MKKGFWGRLFDLVCAYRKYDPATSSRWEIFFLYPGIKAWVLHEMAHALYKAGCPFLPRFLSEWARLWTGIDIHPGAVLGERVIMDHGMGIVIGETAVVEDDVLLYQGVTLGGTSLERTKRHPTVGRGCVVGAGAKILGNIRVGEGCRVGANSVVVRDVPAGSTVVGVPGRIISAAGVTEGHELDHGKLPDPLAQRLQEIERKLNELLPQAKEG